MSAAVDRQTIRAQVAELLGVGADAVDPCANLIGQGLDSIRMMALAGRWRRDGLAIDFATLAATPTIEAWSTLLSSSPRVAVAPAASVTTDEGDAEHAFPLAPMQHALWVGRQDNQRLGGVAGHLYVEFDGGPIDPERLRSAASRLAARHPMLRVRFLPDGTQRIDPPRPFAVTVHDFRTLEAAAVDQQLAVIRETKSQQQLDGQVLELTVSMLPGERSRLHVDLDMQAADAMSYRTLMADLAALYRGRQLPDLGYTYREYRLALERQESAPQPARDADRAWWAQRIPHMPDPPPLPLAPPGDAGETRISTRRWHWLDPQTCGALFANARCRGITPAMALAGSFAHTLARWSGTPRFLLNVPLFARQPLHADVNRVVGDFTSSLLLDIDLTHAATAAARARAVQDELRTAATHSAYSGLSVLRDLSRHRGTQVLASVVFTSALGLGDLFCTEVIEQFGAPSWIISQGPQVLLDAQVAEFDGGVLVNWDVRDRVFAPGVIDAMFAFHIEELRQLAGDGAWDTPRRSALPPSQRAVREACNTRSAEPTGEALHDGFFRRAQLQPTAPALYTGSDVLSYAQLRDQALAVAAALRDFGVRPGDTVAVMGPKNAEQIPALLGILAAGGAYLPVGVDQPPDRVQRIVEAGAVRAAVVCGDGTYSLPVPALTVGQALHADIQTLNEYHPAVTDPAALAYVLFTSGSTGEPKGVEMTHDSAMNTVEFLTRQFEIGAHDRCLALSTLECDMSVLDIFATLRAGGGIVAIDESQRRDPDSWARLIDAHNVTVLNFLPGWLEMLLEVGSGRLSSLRVVATGGDWVRPSLAHRLREQAPTVRFAGLGGATETAVHATICETTNPPAHWTAVPYGKPFPNIACRVVSETGEDCPDWVVGELWISGRGIARGYRGRPDLTAERFVKHRGRTWYRTGDLARYWPDGTLEFIGRADDRVKIGGYRVELGEVEAMLHRVPGVVAAVAASVPTPGGSHVLAAAVRAEDVTLSTSRIRTKLTNLVPAHMIPAHLLLVDRIPYTAGGKIDRRAVTSWLTDAVAATARPSYRAPSTPLEAALSAIIADVLHVDLVGADDDFFAIGGDSVLATQAVARIRTWLDAPDAVVADIFATRTVTALAALLTSREHHSRRLEQVAELYLEITRTNA
nr:non-ribosomal peptide synthetase [Mycobacterium botniense]